MGAQGDDSGTEIQIRPARTSDVRAIKALVDAQVLSGRLLGKATVTLFEDVQEFVVACAGDRLVGAGAIHVLWEDLAEVRTMVVDTSFRGRGVGSMLLGALVERGRRLGVGRLFCLTFEVDFFRHHGFVAAPEVEVPAELFGELVQSHDEGVAEFLDLERVRPNTLGNTRMLLTLDGEGALGTAVTGPVGPGGEPA